MVGRFKVEKIVISFTVLLSFFFVTIVLNFKCNFRNYVQTKFVYSSVRSKNKN